MGRGLPPYQVASWSIKPFGHSRPTPTSQIGQDRTDRQRSIAQGEPFYKRSSAKTHAVHENFQGLWSPRTRTMTCRLVLENPPGQGLSLIWLTFQNPTFQWRSYTCTGHRWMRMRTLSGGSMLKCFHVKIKWFLKISDPSRRHRLTVLFFISGVVPLWNKIKLF